MAMRMKEPCIIKARDLDDAWFQCLWACLQKSKQGYQYSVRYKIDRGSYAGQHRLEIDSCLVDIDYPGYGPLVPQFPSAMSHLAPANEEQVEKYLLYLMTAEKQPNEAYTYGERIAPNIQRVIDMYRSCSGHNTNQAILEVARPEDIQLDDPPCLRLIDTRVREDHLHFIVYFRSWDLYNGFPVNLAGLQQLKKYMADEIGVKDGAIRAFTKGLHLYEDMIDFAKLRIYRR